MNYPTAPLEERDDHACDPPRTRARRLIAIAAALAASLQGTPALAQTQERESLEQLRATTQALIQALVETGAITQAKADELLRAAQARGQVAAGAQGPASPTAEPPPVRVPYVSETTRQRIADEIRQDLVRQARDERWIMGNRLPDWLDRVSVYGDLRIRLQQDRPDSDNTAAAGYYLGGQTAAGLATRWADLADSGYKSGNTTEGESVLRLRARLGTLVQINPQTRADIRLASGGSSSATSTNQTLGNNFNKMTLWLDRAMASYKFNGLMTLQAGRMPVPYDSTEMVWDEDVHLDGVALRLGEQDLMQPGFYGTLGAFPMQAAAQPTRPNAHWLYGVQGGVRWDSSPRTRWLASLAYYDFQGIEGHKETDDRVDAVSQTGLTPDYASSVYNSNLRRKGNTLFRVNAPLDSSATVWGLASRFQPLHLNLGVEFWDLTPLRVAFYADHVRNLGYSRSEIAARTGLTLEDGSRDAWQLRASVGHPQVQAKGEWSAQFSYRWMGSDALVDGLVDSDFGLGGTNQRGYVLSGSYAVAPRTTLGLKLLSARSLASTSLRDTSHSYGISTVQADLQVRF